MIETILQAAGVPCWAGWTYSPPEGNYALYFDDVTTDGPDGYPGQVRRHDATVELYEPIADDAVEAAVEAAISVQGLQWEKQARYWLKDVQLHQVVYNFTFYEKRRA